MIDPDQMVLRFAGRGDLVLDEPRVMGVLNVTPDSFSDGGRYAGVDAAVDAGLAMARAGAAIIDVGGESTRPGSRRVGEAEQIRRVVPVIRGLRAALDEADGFPGAGAAGVVISIDTTRAGVARAAVAAGASMLNDVSAGREDEAMFGLAAEHGGPIVLMHMRGEPGTMQDAPHYEDVAAEVYGFLARRAGLVEAAGVDRSQIVLDPGIGFGKTLEHNLALLGTLDTLAALGYPVLLGASRKRFIAGIDPSWTHDRLGGTVAATVTGVAAGVRLFRVHDVQANRQAALVADAVRRSHASRPGVQEND